MNTKSYSKGARKTNFWLAKELKLKCKKPTCFNYQVVADGKICIKGINMIYIKLLNSTVILRPVPKNGNAMLMP